MFPVPEVFINITFRFESANYYSTKSGQFLPTQTLEDIQKFLEINDFNDYRIICRGITMKPTDKFGFYAYGVNTITVFLYKNCPEFENSDSDEPVVIYVE